MLRDLTSASDFAPGQRLTVTSKSEHRSKSKDAVSDDFGSVVPPELIDRDEDGDRINSKNNELGYHSPGETKSSDGLELPKGSGIFRTWSKGENKEQGKIDKMLRGEIVQKSASKSSTASEQRSSKAMRCFRPNKRARKKKSNYYWEIRDDNFWCDICQAGWFDNLALFVIVCNAVWIGVDVGRRDWGGRGWLLS